MRDWLGKIILDLEDERTKAIQRAFVPISNSTVLTGEEALRHVSRASGVVAGLDKALSIVQEVIKHLQEGDAGAASAKSDGNIGEYL